MPMIRGRSQKSRDADGHPEFKGSAARPCATELLRSTNCGSYSGCRDLGLLPPGVGGDGVGGGGNIINECITIIPI